MWPWSLLVENAVTVIMLNQSGVSSNSTYATSTPSMYTRASKSMTSPGPTKLCIIPEGFGFSQLRIEIRKGAFWNKLGTKQVRSGKWVTRVPSDTNATSVKGELWRSGDSVEEIISHAQLGESKRVE